MTFALIFAFALLFGFVHSQQRHASGFKGASRGFQSVLMLSVIMGFITVLALLVYLFMHAQWYQPIVLLTAGGVCSAILFGVLDSLVGSISLSVVAFVGWPASAYWMYLAITEMSAWVQIPVMGEENSMHSVVSAA